MSAWQAQSASTALERTVLTSSFFTYLPNAALQEQPLLWDKYLPDIFTVIFLNLEQYLAKHRNT